MKKFFALLLCFALTFGVIGSVSAKAEINLDIKLYKGQTKLLPIAEDWVGGDYTGWKVTEGKKNVKIVDNKYIKGLKAGSATLTAKVNDEDVYLYVYVEKAPKTKRKVYFGWGKKLTVPKGFEQQFFDEEEVDVPSTIILNSIKDETNINIQYAGESLSKEELKWKKKNLADRIEEIGLSSLTEKNYSVKDFKVKKDKDVEYGVFDCEKPDVNVYIAWKIFKKGKIYGQLIVTSTDENTVKEIYKMF